MSKKIIIGITDCEKYPNYEKWILVEPDVEVIRLGSRFLNSTEIKNCQGIVLTGGEDIHPGFYGKSIDYPNAPKEYEKDRDLFEMQTFKKAQEQKIPVLGICRGMQLINCALGGNLKQDLGNLNSTHRRISKEDKTHEVTVESSTFLYTISKLTQGNVNSSHHQAIDELGNGLKINCKAADGTIEGVESSNPDHSFLLAVQWHPERMLDQNNALSNNLRKAFLESARKFKP